MGSPIDRLEEALSWYCVMPRLAEDSAMAERWQADPFAHLTEGFIIRPMPTQLAPLVQEALQQWQALEDRCLARLGMTRVHFLNAFELARQHFLSGQLAWRWTILAMTPHVYSVVRNLDWVNVFAWILPRTDAEHADAYRATGRVVTAIFYAELLSRNADEVLVMRRIEARWRLVAPSG